MSLSNRGIIRMRTPAIRETMGFKVGDATVHGRALRLRRLKNARAMGRFFSSIEERLPPAWRCTSRRMAGAEAGAFLRAPHPALFVAPYRRRRLRAVNSGTRRPNVSEAAR